MSMFLEPTVQQYGNNMVMTGVQKPTKKKFVNMDTRFANDYMYPASFHTIEKYTLTLPERLTDVRSIRVRSVEIPKSFYNFSQSLGNTSFKATNITSGSYTTCMIPDGYYASVGDLLTAMNNNMTAPNLQVTLSDAGNVQFVNNTSAYAYDLDFAVDASGNSDKYQLRSKLGWALGVRDSSCVVAHGAPTVLDSLYNMNTVRYLYLVVDELSSASPHSFMAPVHLSTISKHILARICLLSPTVYPFGTVLYGNEPNGVLVTDTRTYTNKIDIQKLNVQLVNEWGQPMDMNGLDFSFVLEIEHE